MLKKYSFEPTLHQDQHPIEREPDEGMEGIREMVEPRSASLEVADGTGRMKSSDRSTMFPLETMRDSTTFFVPLLSVLNDKPKASYLIFCSVAERIE